MRQRSTRCEGESTGDAGLCVLVADADGLARGVMRSSLHELDEVRIVLTAGDGRETLELARHYRPTVLVVDTDLPCPGCLAELVGEVVSGSPRTRVLTWSAGDDCSALQALRAGAVGHLDKDAGPDVLAREVQRAAEGEAIVPRRLTMALLTLVHDLPDAGWRPLRSRLTTREWEVVDMLGEGASTQEIAEALVLCPTTVYSHVKSVLRKLGVHRRDDAIKAAEALRHEEALGRDLPNAVA